MISITKAAGAFDRLHTIRRTLDELEAETRAVEEVLDVAEDDYLRRLAAEAVAAGWFDSLPLCLITHHLPRDARGQHAYRMLGYAPNGRQGDHPSPVRLFLLRDDGRLFSLDTWGFPREYWSHGRWHRPSDRFFFERPRLRLFGRPKPRLRPFEASHVDDVTGWPFRITITVLVDNIERAIEWRERRTRRELRERIVEAERRQERIRAAAT